MKLNVFSVFLGTAGFLLTPACAPDGTVDVETPLSSSAEPATPEATDQTLASLACANDAPFARVRNQPLPAPIGRDPSFYLPDNGTTDKPSLFDADPFLLEPRVRPAALTAELDPAWTGIDPVDDPARYARHKAEILRRSPRSSVEVPQPSSLTP